MSALWVIMTAIGELVSSLWPHIVIVYNNRPIQGNKMIYIRWTKTDQIECISSVRPVRVRVGFTTHADSLI
jgi:hypothetical protein